MPCQILFQIRQFRNHGSTVSEISQKKAFQLFDSKQAQVELLCENSMMNTVLDHFGEKVKTRKIDEGHFSFAAEVSVSPTFFAWVFQFGGRIQIIGPEYVKDAYRELLRRSI